MKIMLVNKFLYPRGGDCVYTLSLGSELQKRGHEVCYFGMQHPLNNKELPGHCFFPSEVDFSSFKGISVEAVRRMFGGGDVYTCFDEILDCWNPEIVWINNVHSYLSPVIARMAKARGCRVVWTLHDYKLICPAYSLLTDGKRCEGCDTICLNTIIRKCVKDSILASILAFVEANYWNKSKLIDYTDVFICPSDFMKEMMLKRGFPKEKLCVINNFLPQEKASLIGKTISELEISTEKAYAYVGRLSEEKGIRSLLHVARQLPYTLYIAGTGPLETSIRNEFSSDKIRFCGQLSNEEVVELMKRVRLTILPSICHDNCPLGVVESMACGTPVLGRRVGGVPDLLAFSPLNRMFDDDSEMSLLLHEMIENYPSLDERKKLSSMSLSHFSIDKYLSTLMPYLVDKMI